VRIALDLDGVLAEWNSAFAQLLESITGRPVIQDAPWPREWHWPQAAGFSSEEIQAAWDFIAVNEDWWFYLSPTPEALELAPRLAELADQHEVMILTNRPGGQNASNAWVLAFLGIIIPVITITGRKGPVAEALQLDYLVDDRPENLANSGGTRGILIAQPWNQDCDWAERMSLGDFLDRVEAFRGIAH
jgi:hypothetical protein